MILLIGVLNGFFEYVKAQDSSQLVLYSISLDSTCKEKYLHKDFDQAGLLKSEFFELEKNLQTQLYSKGYVLAQKILDSNALERSVLISCGLSYKWKKLDVDRKDLPILEKAGINFRHVSGELFHQKMIQSLLEKPLIFLENHGYPFAQTFLDSILIDNGSVSAKLNIEKGLLVHIDSIEIQSDFNLRRSYMLNYIGIKQGGLYQEASIKKIAEKLAASSFFMEDQPVKIFFNDDETKLLLSIKSKQANKFDGIIGFLPNSNNGKILVTGDVTLHLENALSQGEELDIKWQKFQNSTQELKLGIIAPYLLSTPINIDLIGNIYRRDTTFFDVIGDFGLRYVIKKDNFFRAFVGSKKTTLISTKPYQDSEVIPKFLDRQVINYGMGGKFKKLDYSLSPSKGYFVLFDAALGDRRVIINENLKPEIYEQIQINSLQISANFDGAYFLSPIKRMVWHQQYIGSSLINGQLFNNDAHRIGGFKSIRGFNEQAFFATSYMICRSEMRYQFDRDGYVFAFFDAAWYQNKSIDPIGLQRDWPFGFGAGFSFGTKAGIFNLSYALGKQSNIPIILLNNKIHFGFIGVF